MSEIKPCEQVGWMAHDSHFYKINPQDPADAFACPGWAPDEGSNAAVQGDDGDEASYKWPADEAQNGCPPRQVLRYRIPYNSKLVPVWACIWLTERSCQRWLADEYTVRVFESGLIEVSQYYTGIVVRYYAPGAWSRVSYQYRANPVEGFQAAEKLEWMEAGDAG